ncbi:MAG: molybdate ABC transporter substrate-binding protein [Anaerolineae bacterium]|nr:molybdate ABC transporter substrate-binding protein [Anaerolineae bacterium]
MRSKTISLILCLMVLIVSACTPQATPLATEAIEPTAPMATAVLPQATEAPVEPRTLTVSAAASLTESFTELGALFESLNPGVTVTLNFAGSQDLAQQIEQGAEVDVFASANTKYMDAVIETGRVDSSAASTFATNRLAVIYPAENPGEISQLADLAKPGLKLVLADVSVPVGKYSADFLDKASADPAFGEKFKEDVLSNVVSYEENVKAVLTKIVLGEGDAGIVYVTDITPDAAEKVVKLDIPDALNTVATYPLAPLADAKYPELAQAFVDFVLSSQGQEVLSGYGFLPPPNKPETAAPITITDALGREVTLAAAPQRIVIAGRASTLLGDAVYLFPQATGRVVAVSGTTQGQSGTGDFLTLVDPAFTDKVKFDTNVGPEAVAAEQPDVVLMKSYMAETLGTPLEALNIPVVYLDLETPEQYTRDLAILGQLFQDEARATELSQYYLDQVQGVADAIAAAPDAKQPRTLLLYYSSRDGEIAFNVAPKTWIQTVMTHQAGGAPVWEDIELGQGWTKVNFEQVAAWDPEYIFIIYYTGNPDEVVSQLKDDPNWQALSAVQAGKLLAFPKDYYSWDQPDTRWVLGMRWLAQQLQPELFADVDMQAEARAFFSRWYNIDDAVFDESIQPRLQGDL